MIKLLFKLALFLTTLIICDIIIGFGLDKCIKFSNYGKYYKADFSLNNCKADIVIFGACEAEAGIVPSILEDSLKMTCWNAALEGFGLPYAVCIGNGILNRYSPKIAIIVVDENFLSSELDYERTGLLRPFYRTHKEIRPIIDKISGSERFFNFSSLYAYNSSYVNLIKPLLKNLNKNNDSLKGWVPRTTQMFKDESIAKTINDSKRLNQETVSLFNIFVANLKSKGCKVFTIISPTYKVNVCNTSTIEYIKKMKDVALIDYYDNQLITNNYKYFKMYDELNVDGAYKFTSLLAKKVKSLNSD